MRIRITVLTIAVAAMLPSQSPGQSFPTKPIRILVSAAPSVPNDLISRGLSEPLSRAFGQPVIVENRVGADGIIGMEACAKAPSDGYTLCSTASNVIIWNPVLRAKLPYDSLRDLAPVVHVGFFDSALITHPSVPAASVQQLFDLAKAKPESITWAHFGANSTGPRLSTRCPTRRSPRCYRRCSQAKHKWRFIVSPTHSPRFRRAS